MTLVQINSGGQNGVDLAALRAARTVGFPTGGFMPSGWRTHDGPKPEYASLYGLRTMPGSYRERTFANVRESGATLRLAHDMDSAGEVFTWNAIVRYRKPHLSVQVLRTNGIYDALYATSKSVADWIVRGAWSTLNVAGNSERTAPGIGVWAEAFLADVFREVLRQKTVRT